MRLQSFVQLVQAVASRRLSTFCWRVRVCVWYIRCNTSMGVVILQKQCVCVCERALKGLVARVQLLAASVNIAETGAQQSDLACAAR